MKGQQGFSLVELSIVLVILGLLTGGILTGQSLINAAELRAVTTELAEFQTAINSFKQKYGAIPGDMTNATQFWGRADDGSFSGQCSNPAEDTGSGTQTCNGDGNGKVGEWGNPGGPFANYNDTFRFWQHLNNAGLISQSFTGIHGSGAIDHIVPGQNSPASRYSGGGWTVEYVEPASVNSDMFILEYGNHLYIGAPTTNNSTHDPLFTPEEAWNIDKKMDDGMPARGKTISFETADCVNASSQTDLSATYNLSNAGIACIIGFIKMF